eukprot:TRINITY_DN3171_c0_g1_i4.p1 TRINITY_DN3171_c0_g1~~TRINITY_DN3171_c0_g1_i4.p1  ORF type:complete len:494 (-),score=87.03 TRINITY_DN3171_c0_g1_i4:983-2464(-)
MSADPQEFLQTLTHGIPIPQHVDSSLTKEQILELLPPLRPRDASVPHAPVRVPNLTVAESKLAVRNVLRYFPSFLHPILAPEFAEELKTYGHIYCYRFRPVYVMKAYPVHLYPGSCLHTKCIMHMIMNNLDEKVAQFPHELITYGGNGAVFQNWVQYHLVMKYLSSMTEEQTLSMYSGHPMGLFPSSPSAPRVVVTNGMVIPNYSSKADYERMSALSVSMYGQMTAGSYAYIGPQGIVHGTTLTLLNAGRKYLGTSDLRGKVFLTSGLGGMSGAQAKAAVVCGAIGVIAEVDGNAVKKRHAQGWVMETCSSLDSCIERIKSARANKEAVSIAFHGNVIDLWQKVLEDAEQTGELLVELGSDQTSLHNPYNGGYYPCQIGFEEAQVMMFKYPVKFKELVQESLRIHVEVINKLVSKGMKFWDYGNSFLLEASRAGADIMKDRDSFKYPSYVEDIMGDIFSLGFGPFRCKRFLLLVVLLHDSHKLYATMKSSTNY